MMKRLAIRVLCLTSLALAFVALIIWMEPRPKASSARQTAQTKPVTLQATLSPQQASAAGGILKPAEDEIKEIDMAALGIHPIPDALAYKSGSGSSPSSNSVGKGNAFMCVCPEVVNQSVTNAAIVQTSGWTLGETVQIFFNGSSAGTVAASATTGRATVGVTTGAGFGYIVIEMVGATSAKRAGGVLQVDSTGPYLPGLCVAPHSVNTSSATGTIGLFGRGFTPAGSTVTIYRNGVSLGTVASSTAAGLVSATITPGNNGDTSAVYSANTTTISMAGQSVEERSDAGTPPVGDQNVARAFVDRAVINSTTVTTFIVSGEGFQAGETINFTGAVTGSGTADANGAISAIVTSGTGAGVYNMVLTGATSARVARASVLAHATVTNIRGIIVSPSLAAPGSIVTARVDRLPASTSGDFLLDGVSVGTTTTDASGTATMAITAPLTGFAHEVGFAPTTGGSQATVLNVLATPTAAPSTISGRIKTPDGAPLGGTVVRLGGSASRTAISDSAGYYRFEGLDTAGFYTVTPERANYSFSPSSQSFNQLGNQTEAVFAANPNAETANPLDTSEYFVRQQYLDFLDREPDQGGFNYWSDQINGCGTDAACTHNRRVDVSAAYFMSEEFQKTGSFVYGLYKGSLGRDPRFAEFVPDRSHVLVGNQLEPSKQALAEDWVTRSEFRAQYPDSLSNAEFVNKLFDTAGLSVDAARQNYINAMENGATRAQVLKGLIESDAFMQKEYNRAFILTQYFGYLRRDPDDAGLEFWLGVLNDREPNNYRGMVCSFLTSAEYQKRFSSVVTHSNSECGQ